MTQKRKPFIEGLAIRRQWLWSMKTGLPSVSFNFMKQSNVVEKTTTLFAKEFSDSLYVFLNLFRVFCMFHHV